ncbi:unnamed protein product [Timema podura]|uniref:Uncharacterized protein n=1 Tax=Timema podura TaxID=61482 RepID=A0ABN7NE48_TIMPD|nr:unnamed protein product [Timema podura]
MRREECRYVRRCGKFLDGRRQGCTVMEKDGDVPRWDKMEVILRFPTGPAMRGEKGKIYGAQVGMQATKLQLINNRSSLPEG